MIKYFLRGHLKEKLAHLEARCKYLLEARDSLEAQVKELLDMTEMLDEHPEDYEGQCLCKLCKSYMEPC